MQFHFLYIFYTAIVLRSLVLPTQFVNASVDLFIIESASLVEVVQPNISKISKQIGTSMLLLHRGAVGSLIMPLLMYMFIKISAMIQLRLDITFLLSIVSFTYC